MRQILLLVLVLSASTAHGEILKVKLDGVIDPITSEFITDAVQEAEAQEAEFLLIENFAVGRGSRKYENQKKNLSHFRLILAQTGALRARSKFQVPGFRSGLEFGIWNLEFQPVSRLWSVAS